MNQLPKKFRAVFLGTGDIGLPALRALASYPEAEVAAVITQPDRPAGRGHALVPGPVKVLAMELGIPVLQPAKLRAPEAVESLRALSADLFVVMAYGQILSKAVLDLPRVCTINLHASLLPRHRGASPIQSAILAGDAESGITVMYVDEGLDTGDILLKMSCALDPDETAGSLHDKLAQLAPFALMEALRLLQEGAAPRIPQDASLATYAPKLKKEDGLLDWTMPAVLIERTVRAFNPWPGAFGVLAHPLFAHRPLKIWKSSILPGMQESFVPGRVSGIDQGKLLVEARDGVLELLEVQLESRRRMSAAELLRGLR
jgi:methionyl-tRNA formyltransferase